MDLSNDLIKEIVGCSVWYPSGDNCQPWTFVWGQRKLRIFHSSNRAGHPLNAGGIASRISLGCLVEGLSLSASKFGYHAKVQFYDFMDGAECCWADVNFLPVQRPEDPLAKSMSERSTDRRLFNKGILPVNLIEDAANANADLVPAQLHCLTTLTPELVEYIVNSEKLMMDHSKILPKVLEWTRFSQAETQRLRDGLSLKNMGIRFWEVPALQIIKSYPTMLHFMKGMMIPQHMARVSKQLNSSAGLVCVSIPRGQAQQTPNAGRMMYRAWLALTGQGFGVQPLTIASTLVFCAQAGLLDETFSPQWVEFFKGGEAILRRAFHLPEDHLPIWMVRTGLSSPLPLALRTLRRPVEDILRFEE